ncbi:MAG: hypothetical protein HBSAPP03_26440 [Phycisphaerae bacterium]|nr:MAG: hypothetical protein HBSAPP03_26440 [Phycisphaerae bacterium]
MKQVLVTAVAAGWMVVAGSVMGQTAAAPAAPAAVEPVAAAKPVDLAICLDTSGSMDGLIDAARQKLWGIVSDLATAKPRPALRVALLSFGNDSYTPESGWVKVLIPFTTDLDEVSKQLFALTTNGGTEYVGRVVHKAAADLAWTQDAGAMKLIIVAGNEGADQDATVTYQQACGEAIGKGIMVNAIYCGDANDGIAPGWRDVAKLADGEFAAIDQNRNEVIPTPHDSKLAELSAAINATYVAYGAHGTAGRANQAEQDANVARAAPAAVAQRASMKATGLYSNRHWDLVDAVFTGEEKDRVKLESLKEEELPEAMRTMTLAERKSHLESMLKQRAEIQRQIAEETVKRDAFLEQARREQAAAEGRADFESVLRAAVRKQAERKGFSFK